MKHNLSEKMKKKKTGDTEENEQFSPPRRKSMSRKKSVRKSVSSKPRSS